MEGFFINRAGNALTAPSGDVKLALLGRRSDLEVMMQSLNEGAVVWIVPAEDSETMEFFYILEGVLTLTVNHEEIRLSAGDSFYADALADEVLLHVEKSSRLLYITNRPLFDEALSFQGDLEELMKRVDEKDKYTYRHSRNVMDYSLMIARRIDPKRSINDLSTAALFHDVGKCLVPDEILKKPGRLTDAEFRQMMKHPVNSGRLLRNRFGEHIAEIARSHHERLDGSGYPFGLSGKEIPWEARIIAVADSFDAMTSLRVYRRGCKNVLEAAEELCSLPKLYDRDAAAALLALVRDGEIKDLFGGQNEDSGKV